MYIWNTGYLDRHNDSHVQYSSVSYTGAQLHANMHSHAVVCPPPMLWSGSPVHGRVGCCQLPSLHKCPPSLPAVGVSGYAWSKDLHRTGSDRDTHSVYDHEECWVGISVKVHLSMMLSRLTLAGSSKGSHCLVLFWSSPGCICRTHQPTHG